MLLSERHNLQSKMDREDALKVSAEGRVKKSEKEQKTIDEIEDAGDANRHAEHPDGLLLN